MNTLHCCLYYLGNQGHSSNSILLTSFSSRNPPIYCLIDTTIHLTSVLGYIMFWLISVYVIKQPDQKDNLKEERMSLFHLTFTGHKPPLRNAIAKIPSGKPEGRTACYYMQNYLQSRNSLRMMNYNSKD